MKYDCKLSEQAVQHVLSIRTRTSVGNLPQALENAYDSIMQYLGDVGEQPAGAPFAAYYNMDMEDLDVEMGFPVSKLLQGKGEIHPGEIPPGKQAVCVYTGPYSQMGPAYEALMQWIAENGYTATGVSYEFYLNNPDVTPEGELQTKIVFPLK